MVPISFILQYKNLFKNVSSSSTLWLISSEFYQLLMDYWDILFTDLPYTYHAPLIHSSVTFLQQSQAPHCYFMSVLGNSHTDNYSKIYLDMCLKL